MMYVVSWFCPSVSKHASRAFSDLNAAVVFARGLKRTGCAVACSWVV